MKTLDIALMHDRDNFYHLFSVIDKRIITIDRVLIESDDVSSIIEKECKATKSKEDFKVVLHSKHWKDKEVESREIGIYRGKGR